MAAPRHDWYLKDWLKTCNTNQERLSQDLDINKATVSHLARGIQPYSRDYVNQIAEYLNIQPYELLMHPADAFTIRRLLVEADKMSEMGKRLKVVNSQTGTEG